MNRKQKIGVTLISIGIVSLVIPILPGFLFLGCGILLVVKNKYGDVLYEKTGMILKRMMREEPKQVKPSEEKEAEYVDVPTKEY